MPRKPYKKKKSTYRRKKYASPIPMGTSLGVPQSRTVRMRYSTDVEIASNAGVMGVHYFRANSVYDPDATGAGHSPAGFSTMQSLYQHYVVIGSKISITWSNNSSSTTSEVPTRVGVFLNDDNSLGVSNYWELIENGRGTSKMIGSGNSNLYHVTRTMGKFSAKRFFNITDVKDNRNTLGAAVTTNPSEEAYFAVWSQAIGTGTAALAANVTIDYIVTFGEPIVIS